MKGNIKTTLFVKIFTYIILTYTCHYKNNELTSGNYFDKRYNIDKTLNIRNKRLLSKYDFQSETRYPPSSGYLTSDASSRTLNNEEKPMLKNKKGKYYGHYIRHYGSGSGNPICVLRKGIKQIDNNIEKKVFNYLGKESEYEENNKVMNKKYKRTIFKKYDIYVFWGYVLPLFVTTTIMLLDFSLRIKNGSYIFGAFVKNLSTHTYILILFLTYVICALVFCYLGYKIEKYTRVRRT
ncbi:variable surface protein [Plasmodium gonderi]|uniref:Variable surface protein n=1 Tax=Plasmodium gonderi TaxID=77519 RepID=A0A1Y1JRW4_PLAGO|nr:variable surface protein [Plasmodium gonderi]GAW83213.1 variable surface protein [Plasmodium gonderi]